MQIDGTKASMNTTEILSFGTNGLGNGEKMIMCIPDKTVVLRIYRTENAKANENGII